MFEQIVNQGQSLRGVALALNRKGIPSPLNKKWTFVTVSVIVRNEVYAGRCYYNVRKRQRNGQIVVRDRAEWIPIKVTPNKVWTEIVAAINNPDQTRQGYTDAKVKHDALTRRQRDHIANLQANLAKTEARKARLDRMMYSDPDLEMTKEEYLKQKTEIDAERKDLETRIEKAQAELAKVHAPVSLETFDRFMNEIRRILEAKIDPTPEMRRQALQLLHVKVLMSRSGEPDIDGWFRPGLSSNTH